jgi:hypothetical protein
MSWTCNTCNTCGVEQSDIPLCFSIEAPWRALVPVEEFRRKSKSSTLKSTSQL